MDRGTLLLLAFGVAAAAALAQQANAGDVLTPADGTPNPSPDPNAGSNWQSWLPWLSSPGGNLTPADQNAPGTDFWNTAVTDSAITDIGTINSGIIPPQDYFWPTSVDASQTMADLVNVDPQIALNAFLASIRQFESHNDYYILYGGGHFSDDSRFPYTAVNQGVPFYNPRKAGPRGTPNDYSTASGAYQINLRTYQEFAPIALVSDFSPEAQDALAIAILRQSGAYKAILANNIPGAFQLASARWASLPGSTAGQGAQSMTVALNTFDQFVTAA